MNYKRVERITKNGFRFEVSSVKRMDKVRQILLKITSLSAAQLDTNGRLYEEAMKHYNELRDTEELMAMFPDPSKFKVFIEVSLAKWCGRVNLKQIERAHEIIEQVRHPNGQITQERFQRAVQLAKSDRIPDRILREAMRCTKAGDLRRIQNAATQQKSECKGNRQPEQAAGLQLTAREIEMIKQLRQQQGEQGSVPLGYYKAPDAEVPSPKVISNMQEKIPGKAANDGSADSEMLASMMRYLRT